MINFNKFYNVKVFHAVENGSRAWGYDSVNSDYDVKFIFHHDKNEYLNLLEPKDVIIHKEDNVEYSGWDIKKFLLLLNKGNAQCYEYFMSPITYINAPEGFKLFVLQECYNKINLINKHYYRLAKRTYKERILNTGEPTYKRYLYIVRPLLSVQYSLSSNMLPLLNLKLLLDNCVIDYTIKDMINEIITKRKLGENLPNIRESILDKWIEDRLCYMEDKINETYFKTPIEEYNKIFKEIIYGS